MGCGGEKGALWLDLQQYVARSSHLQAVLSAICLGCDL